MEVDYFLHGGILPYVLRQLIAEAPDQAAKTPTSPDLQEPETSRAAAGGI